MLVKTSNKEQAYKKKHYFPWVPWVTGETGALVFQGDRVSVWVDEKVLEMDGGDGCIRK